MHTFVLIYKIAVTGTIMAAIQQPWNQGKSITGTTSKQIENKTMQNIIINMIFVFSCADYIYAPIQHCARYAT